MEEKIRIGVYICHCGINIAGPVDVEKVVEFARTLPSVKIARDYRYMCSDPGQQFIKDDIKEHKLNRVIVASCNPHMHEPTFRRACQDGGLNPYLFQMVNIREQCSWVHKEGTTEKAKALVKAAVKRVGFHEPLKIREVPVNPNVLVVGAGIAGIEAALKVADSEHQVYLVEEKPSIGGHMAQFDKTFPTLDCAACILTPKMTSVKQHPFINLMTLSEVAEVSGYVGNYKVKIRRKPRYVDESKCTACGDCLKDCPVKVVSEFNEGLGERNAVYIPFPQAVPNSFVIDKKQEKSPCKVTCPAKVNGHGYVSLVGQGKFKEALALIRERNPFPSICGRICHHPCEDECLRGKVDEPIALAALKRFVADHEADEEVTLPNLSEIEKKEEKVAIVGSGPAGMTAAYDLRQMGYQVTIFEALARPGGMFHVGIPEYRLPRRLIEKEIASIEKLGVEIKTNTPIGPELTLDDLSKEGYRATFIAVGMQKGKILNIPGRDLKNVLNGLEFLADVNSGKVTRLGERVVVIGGGNVAMDVARCAVRIGGSVHITCLEARDAMPAHTWQVAATEEEILATEEEISQGKKEERIHCSLAPVKILSENGKVKGVEFLSVKHIEFNKEGKLTLKTIPGSEKVLEADTVIIAIGQSPDKSLLDLFGLKITNRGTIEADPVTLETSRSGVFAGGDVAIGPSSVVEAIEAGHEGALSIDRYLREKDLREGRTEEVEKVTEPRIDAIPTKRQIMPMKLVEERIRDFSEVELGFDEEMAIKEAKRCLNCGGCSECLECVKLCEAKAIDHKMKQDFVEVDVGSIILATGFDCFDPSVISQYGYGHYDNVLTGLQFERTCNASGPTSGKILLKNGSAPKSIGIIHCVGSRDENYHEYCSRVCCMYSLKYAHLIKEKTGADVYEFYMDMRCFGKGYEEFHKRLANEGITFIRGKVSEVTNQVRSNEEKGKLVICCEDTLLGALLRVPVDMVILSTALEARSDAEKVARLFSLSRSGDKFFLERHPKLDPVGTMVDGIFIAGCCQGPKDIPDTVAQAQGAAANALAMISKGKVEIEPITAAIDEKVCSGCKVCIPLCTYKAISFDEEKKVARIEEALCKGCGVCAAACPAEAIKASHFTREQIEAEIEGVLK